MPKAEPKFESERGTGVIRSASWAQVRGRDFELIRHQSGLQPACAVDVVEQCVESFWIH